MRSTSEKCHTKLPLRVATRLRVGPRRLNAGTAALATMSRWSNALAIVTQARRSIGRLRLKKQTEKDRGE